MIPFELLNINRINMYASMFEFPPFNLISNIVSRRILKYDCALSYKMKFHFFNILDNINQFDKY